MEPLTHFQEDILADVLRPIQLQSTLYCRAVMGAPWGFRFTSSEVASFHAVTAGTCCFSLDGSDKAVLLSEGDLVSIPHGHAHTMTDQLDSPVTRLDHLQPTQPIGKEGVCYYGGQGAVTTLVCGGLQLGGSATNPLLTILPPSIHRRGRKGQSIPWLKAL